MKKIDNSSNRMILPTALITGASRGLGREIALKLSVNDFRVVVNYRMAEAEAEQTLARLNRHSISIQADIGKRKDVENMAELIARSFGRIDAMILNAGITRDSLLLKTREDEWEEVIATNLKGAYNVIKIISPLMIQSGGGHIIAISSLSAVRGRIGQAAYSASKSALLGLMKTAAGELSEYNIRANVILPGYMATDMGRGSEVAMKTARKESLLGALSDPKKVADFILFLIGTGGITGQVFNLDSRIL